MNRLDLLERIADKVDENPVINRSGNAFGEAVPQDLESKKIREELNKIASEKYKKEHPDTEAYCPTCGGYIGKYWGAKL